MLLGREISSWEGKNSSVLLLWREDIHKCNILKGPCRSLVKILLLPRVLTRFLTAVLKNFFHWYEALNNGDWATQCQLNTTRGRTTGVEVLFSRCISAKGEWNSSLSSLEWETMSVLWVVCLNSTLVGCN